MQNIVFVMKWLKCAYYEVNILKFHTLTKERTICRKYYIVLSFQFDSLFQQSKCNNVLCFTKPDLRVGLEFHERKISQHDLYFLSGMKHVFKCRVPLDVTTSQFSYRNDPKFSDRHVRGF